MFVCYERKMVLKEYQLRANAGQNRCSAQPGSAKHRFVSLLPLYEYTTAN